MPASESVGMSRAGFIYNPPGNHSALASCQSHRLALHFHQLANPARHAMRQNQKTAGASLPPPVGIATTRLGMRQPRHHAVTEKLARALSID